jgi:hypothetical protein
VRLWKVQMRFGGSLITVERIDEDGRNMACVNRRIDASTSRSSFDRLYRRNLAMAICEMRMGWRGSDWDVEARISWRSEMRLSSSSIETVKGE